MNVLVIVSLLAGSASAQCAPLFSAQAVLDCALQNDPAVKLAVARRAQAESGVGWARQRPNPEVSGKRTEGDSTSRTELDLVQTIETGGKRAARVGRAEAGLEAAAAEARVVQAETALKTVAALYRLRQLQGELSLINEALSAFSRVGKQLRSRPRLAPEQEVSGAIFELAGADYALKRASLGAEQRGLLKALEASVGAGLALESLDLPPARQEWPAIPLAAAPAGPETLGAQATLKAARAERASAQAASWPDLRLGPSLERETQSGQRRQTVGLNLGLPLPLFHRNAAGREQARRGEDAAVLGLEAVQAALRAERETELARYEMAVAALALADGRKEVHAKHERVEDFFQRGLISSSLVIEAHRQMFEFTRDRHEHELAAIRALWRIRAIDGQILEEKL